MTLVTAFKGKQ